MADIPVESDSGHDLPSTPAQEDSLLDTLEAPFLGMTGIPALKSLWDLADETVTAGVINPAKAAINSGETKLEQITNAVEDKFNNQIGKAADYIKDEHDRTNTSLQYVAIIAALLAGVYVLSLAAPFLPRGKA